MKTKILFSALCFLLLLVLSVPCNVAAGERSTWAVLEAIRWLKAHQNADGSWGEEPLQPAMTSLALLCCLGYGEDHLSHEFGATVRNAITWLVKQQDKDGAFAWGPGSATQHAIATYAMAEAYGMTKLEDLRPVVAIAVRRICDGQTDEGGWYENYAKADGDGNRLEGGDTCVSGWQIQALTAAWYAGIRFRNEMLRDARTLAAKDMKSRFRPETGFGDKSVIPPRPKELNDCTTAIGTLSLMFLGERDSPEVKGGLEIMKTYTCDWKNADGDRSELPVGGAGPPLLADWEKPAFPVPGPLRTWYYVTQAMFLSGETPKDNEYWKHWNPLFSHMLVEQQTDYGSWDYPMSEAGRLERARFQGKNQLVYSTAMCCLMLEVYYRYLPTYWRLPEVGEDGPDVELLEPGKEPPAE